MIKLLSQLEQVERATPLARREEGKISRYVRLMPGEHDERIKKYVPEGIAHGIGPQVAPKASM